MTMTEEQITDFLQNHLPHRLVLLTTFRDRQAWFAKSYAEGRPDGDLLRTAKDSAVMAIRMMANFLGLTLDNVGKLQAQFPRRKADDVFVIDLRGKEATLADLSESEQKYLEGLLRRANKELAHLTCNFQNHDDFNTVEAIERGIETVERLLRQKVYDVVDGANGKYPFPNLDRERKIHGTGWELRSGPLSVPPFRRA